MACLFALAPSAQAQPLSTPIDVSDAHAYVQLRIPQSPRPLWFLLDSGAATPVDLIGKATADALGIKGQGAVTAGAIGGKVQVSFTPPLRLSLAGRRLATEQLAIIPLGGAEDEASHPVDGLLGYAFFSKYNPEIDYPRARLRIADNWPARAEAIPMHIAGKTVMIDATIILKQGEAPTPVRLIVDTGYDASLIFTSPFVRKHGLLKNESPVISGAGVGGTTSRVSIALPSLSIGAETVTNVDAQLSVDDKGNFATDEADGYIGGEILKKYRVLFDYRHGRFALSR